MSNRILVVTQQGEARFLTSESTPTRVITIQPTGARGEAGSTGATGAGVPTGGATDDILKKTSETNYATEWETPTSGATPSTIVRRDETGGAFFGGDVGASKYRGNNYQAESSTDGASLRNSAGTAYLTWGATAGNISITVDTTSTGHFYSAPSTATAGHFVTKNGTAPSIAAGRSAWFSNGSGDPQFRNGTGSAVTLVYNGGALGTPNSGTLTSCTGLPVSTGISGLGTGIATFLATPSSANLIAAVTDETGDGDLVTNANPTIYDIYLEDGISFNGTSYTYGTGSAALHRTALGLTALATTTPGTGVATALAINVGSAGAVVTFNGALGTPGSGTLTSCTSLPIATGVSGLGTGVATLLTGTPSGTGGPVGTTSPTLTTPTIGAATGTTLTLGTTLPTATICNVYSAGSSATNTWRGRITAGGDTCRFLMGEINGQAWLGAHNAALSAWNDFYINPDGGAKVGIGDLGGGSGNVAVPILSIDNANGLSTFGGPLALTKTITAGGTTGAQTINKTSGSVNFAAAATSLVVTNSLCTANSVIVGMIATNDATANGLRIVAGSGSFTIYMLVAPTAETRVNFILTN